jgi:hypothetical protein
MSFFHPIAGRSTLAAALLVGAFAFAAPAQAAKLGPYFPIPNSFNIRGEPREALLSIQESWLKRGIDNLEKAKKEADAAHDEAKARDLDKEIDATRAELALATDKTPGPVQKERKDKLLLNVNQWINELEHLATEQMKIAIMADGPVALSAQQQNHQYSQSADDLQRAKLDYSMEIWGK